jgi:hypothetical protein
MKCRVSKLRNAAPHFSAGGAPPKPLTDGPPLRASRGNMPPYNLSTSGPVIIVLLARRLGTFIRVYLLRTGRMQKVYGTTASECR